MDARTGSWLVGLAGCWLLGKTWEFKEDQPEKKAADLAWLRTDFPRV